MSYPMVAIGDLAQFTGGGTPSKSNPAFFEGHIPWVSSKDMKSWKIGHSQQMITEEAIERSAAKLLPKDTVLIVVRSGILKHTLPVAISTKPLTINQDLKGLICSKEVDPAYLARMIKAAEPIVLSWVRATTADNFPVEKLKALEVRLPPLPKQKRIAAILDQADDLRHKRAETLKRIDEGARLIFVDMFGNPALASARWEKISFSEACRDETARSEKIQRGGYASSGDIPVVDQGQSVVAGWTDDERLLCRSALPVVVFGDHTRNVKLVDFPFAIGADGAKVLAVSDCLDVTFFSYFLRLAPIPDLGYSRHMRELKRMQFWRPPLPLQKEFASRIASLDQQRRHAKRHLEILETLFASLQHRAFRGEF